jgi:hypothetical protein
MFKKNITQKTISYCYLSLVQLLILFTFFSFFEFEAVAQVITPVPPEWRGNIDAERIGHHDANLIRTRYRSYGMVGD